MIHEARFCRRIQDDTGKDTLHLVLQAMVLVASRYVSSNVVADMAMTFAGDQEDFRDWIVAKATKSMSVENLQALIIICFNDASGHSLVAPLDILTSP